MRGQAAATTTTTAAVAAEAKRVVTPDDMPVVPDGACVRVLYAESPMAGPPADIEAATGGLINLNVFHTGLILGVLGPDDSAETYYTVDYYATKGVGSAVLPKTILVLDEPRNDDPTPGERSAAGSSTSEVIAQLVSSASSAGIPGPVVDVAADAAEKAEAAVSEVSQRAGALASTLVDQLRSAVEAAVLEEDEHEVELAAWENDAGVFVTTGFDTAYWKQPARQVATLTKEQYNVWAHWVATNYVPNHPTYQLFNVYTSFPLAADPPAADADAACPSSSPSANLNSTNVPHPIVASSTCNDFVWESFALFRAHGVADLDKLDPPLRKNMVVLVTGPQGANALERIDNIEDPATDQDVARFYHGLSNVLMKPHTIESVRSGLSLLKHVLDRVAYVRQGPPGQHTYYRVRLDQVDTLPIKFGYYPLPLTSRIDMHSF